MKKLIAGVLALCIIGGAMPLVNNYAPGSAITASAEERFSEEIIDYFRFAVYSDHAELVECAKGEKVDFIIPSEVNSVPVTIIRNHAFDYCTNLNSVIIPDTVTSIGNGAFSGTSLKLITIPDSVKKIGIGVFRECSSLESITIPDSVTNIGENAFSGCSSLESITILNPDCKIYDSRKTIYNGIDEYRFNIYDGIYFNGTIYGYANSTAQAYAEKYDCKFEALADEPTSEPTSTIKGDANLDSNVNIADAVLVMQVATNPDKYAQGKSEFSISAQGEINADVDGKAGLTNSDALLIQKFKLWLIQRF